MNYMSMVTVDKQLYVVVVDEVKPIHSIMKSVDGKEWEETDYKMNLKRIYGHTIISSDNLCK